MGERILGRTPEAFCEHAFGLFDHATAGHGSPQAGDLIVWGGQHIGIVESVDADGKIHTVEGNSSNMVTRRTHDASGDGATGYVRLG